VKTNYIKAKGRKTAGPVAVPKKEGGRRVSMPRGYFKGGGDNITNTGDRGKQSLGKDI